MNFLPALHPGVDSSPRHFVNPSPMPPGYPHGLLPPQVIFESNSFSHSFYQTPQVDPVWNQQLILAPQAYPPSHPYYPLQIKPIVQIVTPEIETNFPRVLGFGLKLIVNLYLGAHWPQATRQHDYRRTPTELPTESKTNLAYEFRPLDYDQSNPPFSRGDGEEALGQQERLAGHASHRQGPPETRPALNDPETNEERPISQIRAKIEATVASLSKPPLVRIEDFSKAGCLKKPALEPSSPSCPRRIRKRKRKAKKYRLMRLAEDPLDVCLAGFSLAEMPKVTYLSRRVVLGEPVKARLGKNVSEIALSHFEDLQLKQIKRTAKSLRDNWNRVEPLNMHVLIKKAMEGTEDSQRITITKAMDFSMLILSAVSAK